MKEFKPETMQRARDVYAAIELIASTGAAATCGALVEHTKLNERRVSTTMHLLRQWRCIDFTTGDYSTVVRLKPPPERMQHKHRATAAAPRRAYTASASMLPKPHQSLKDLARAVPPPVTWNGTVGAALMPAVETLTAARKEHVRAIEEIDAALRAIEALPRR